jgi:hypothetical protein
MTEGQLFNPKDHYALVTAWWKAAGWPVLPLTHLSDIGQMVYVNGKPAVAGWIFQSDSAWCFFEFIIANPEIRNEERKEAFDHLFSWAKFAAEAMGFKNILSMVSNESLIERLVENGFAVTDKNMTNLVFVVGGKNV